MSPARRSCSTGGVPGTSLEVSLESTNRIDESTASPSLLAFFRANDWQCARLHCLLSRKPPRDGLANR